jgi:hypothetical protein
MIKQPNNPTTQQPSTPGQPPGNITNLQINRQIHSSRQALEWKVVGLLGCWVVGLLAWLAVLSKIFSSLADPTTQQPNNPTTQQPSTPGQPPGNITNLQINRQIQVLWVGGLIS